MAAIRLATGDDAAAVRDSYAPVVENTAVSFEDDPEFEAALAASEAGVGT